MVELPKEGFVRLSTVLKLIPVSVATWYRGLKSGKFPKPINLGPNSVAWRVEDIRELISQLSDEKKHHK